MERVFSGDSHVMEPNDLWSNALLAKWGDATPRGIDEHRGVKGHFFYIGREVLKLDTVYTEVEQSGFARAGFDPAVRLDFQRSAGVEGEVLYPTHGMVLLRSCREDVLKDAARVFNDWILEFSSVDPKRFIPVGMIPMHDVDFAVAELNRLLARGFRAALINADMPPSSPAYRDPVYDPFWARAAEADFAVTLHAASGQILSPFHYHNKADQERAPRAMLAVFSEAADVLTNEFIFGGVLDRFENLTLVQSEFEISWIPHVMWRIDQMQSSFAHRMPLPKLKHKASDYLRERVWHGLVDDPLAAEALPHLRSDRVMWGSDFPHVRSAALDTKGVLSRLFERLSPADRDALVWSNTRKLYRL